MTYRTRRAAPARSIPWKEASREKGYPLKKMQRLASPVVAAYLWVMMVLFGAIVLETFISTFHSR